MTLLGYARVSRVDQNPELQEEALRSAGCERIWVERASGKTAARTELTALLDYLRAGDTLVVWKLDRLGRSLSHLVSLLADLERREVHFRSLTEGMDTATPAGRALFHICGTFAQMEREIMLERTRSGLAIARAQGRTGGLKPKLSREHLAEAKRMADEGRSTAEIADILHVHRSTLYRALTRVAAA